MERFNRGIAVGDGTCCTVFGVVTDIKRNQSITSVPDGDASPSIAASVGDTSYNVVAVCESACCPEKSLGGDVNSATECSSLGVNPRHLDVAY